MNGPFSVSCVCGKTIDVEAFVPGSNVKCPHCRIEMEMLPEDSAVAKTLASPALTAGAPQCPNCGANMEITYQGEKKDKVGTCAHCQTTVDLPDYHGTSTEKITRTPGKEVIDRITTFVSNNPLDLEKACFSGEMPEETQSSEKWTIDGKDFDSFTALESYVRKTLPPGTADAVLEQLKKKG